jgi:hypothetical protein
MNKRPSLLNLYSGSRKARVVFLFAFILPVLIIYVTIVLLPGLSNPFKDSSAAAAAGTKEQTAQPQTIEQLNKTQTLIALEIDEAFYNAQLQLAKNDSVGVLLDLRDSLAVLQIKGVPVRNCKIQRFKVGYALNFLKAHGGLREWLSSPFSVQREFATLPKAPIRVMIAPADTNEASATNSQEIPVEKNDVHYTLEFDRNLTVTVEQAQMPSFKGWVKKVLYDMHRSLTATREMLYSLTNHEMPHNRVWIDLELSREDAKAIYRALPHKAGMVLKL